MRKLKFGLFASIKKIDKYIDHYKLISQTCTDMGLEHYKPWIITEYPYNSKRLLGDDDTIVTTTNRQIREINFAIAEFSTKSRTVFFQTILALESKIPVLSVVEEKYKGNLSRFLNAYENEFLTIRIYRSLSDLEDIVREFVENIDPPKKRFNIVLKTTTLKQMEQLCNELEISKAELIRRSIAREFKRIFNS